MKQISLKNYYLFALWLPLIIPAIIYITDPHEANRGIGDNILPALFYASAIVGGAQYLVFALWTSYRYHKSSADELEDFFYKAPVQFVPICAAGVLLFFIIGDLNSSHPSFPYGLGNILIGSFIISLPAIPYGYFYVFLTIVLKSLLTGLDIVKE